MAQQDLPRVQGAQVVDPLTIGPLEAEAQRRMADETYVIELVLGDGPGRAVYVTSDIGHGYVDVNAGYRS